MAALRGQFRRLANDRNLRRFVVQARPTGRQLGTGSYGTVEEVEVNGLVCAGKKIHEILLDVGNVGVRDIAAKYVQECQLMSDLRHPNITLFLGLCFLPNCQLPVLVMERLDSSLDDLLESVPNIPLALKRSMLEDVARGLLYLHNHDPQVIHRDLTAKNVLLTPSLVAKITDFGNSRIVNIQPGQLAQTLSRNPGTLVYMPPEALADTARYGPSLDIFSFGHLGIFVGLQIFPGKLLEPTYSDPENQESLLARSETERRQVYIDQLDRKLPEYGHHPFVRLVKLCLKNTALQRPAAEDVLRSLEEMKPVIDGPCGEVARADAVRQVVMMRAILGRETEVRRKTDESAAKDEEIDHLQQELEQEQAERARSEEQLQRVRAQLQRMTTELQQRDAQIQQHTANIRQKDAQIQQQVADIRQKDAQIQQQVADIRQKDAQIQQEAAIIQQKDTQIQQKEEQLRQATDELQQTRTELNIVQKNLQDREICVQSIRADLEDREARLRAQEEEMKVRDAEINRLLGELRRCQTQLLGHVQQTPLKGPLKLKWKRGEDIPYSMSSGIQAVVIGDNVYVGGGSTKSVKNPCTVMVYSLASGSWSKLPPHKTRWFGMAAVNNQLVLFGGNIDHYNVKVTSILAMWDEGSQTWTRPFPETPTQRCLSSIISYQKWLVVAGGGDGIGSYSNKVEILDTLSGQWYEGSPIPIASGCSEMSSAINGNMWYLSRGFSFQGPNKHVFSVNLDELISQALSQSAGNTSPPIPSPWQTLTDPPLIHSTVLVLNGALLTVGGEESSAIHYYQPSSRSWVKVGDLPTERWMCACTVLPNGEIFVAGGYTSMFERSVRVDLGVLI